VVFEVDVEFVGSWNALKKCFPGGLEGAAQRILEDEEEEKSSWKKEEILRSDTVIELNMDHAE
jgi:hypothetical protein